MISSGAVRDLQSMLKGMKPQLDDRAFRFEVIGEAEPLPVDAFAMVREVEGTTAVRLGAPVGGPGFARITLQVHSDLEGVGLTACVATVLASAEIACNVIAGFHHDHVFVPWDHRRKAMELLIQLSAEA